MPVLGLQFSTLIFTVERPCFPILEIAVCNLQLVSGCSRRSFAFHFALGPGVPSSSIHDFLTEIFKFSHRWRPQQVRMFCGLMIVHSYIVRVVPKDTKLDFFEVLTA